MTTHTPGPWNVMDNGRTLLHIETDIAAPIAGVAVCSVPKNATGRANARLIAAAPEMLEELQAVADLLAAYIYGESGDGEPVEMCAFAEREVAARALLARLEN